MDTVEYERNWRRRRIWFRLFKHIKIKRQKMNRGAFAVRLEIAETVKGWNCCGRMFKE